MLGILPGVVGTIQATEAVKLIIGAGEPLINRFMIYDALAMRFRELKLRRDPDCPVCGGQPYGHGADRLRAVLWHRAGCADGGVFDETETTVDELKAQIDQGEEPFILDVRELQEYQICQIPDSTLIPLGDLPSRLVELEGRADMVVHCKSGVRSAKAVKLLPRGWVHAGKESAGRNPRLDR